MAIDPNEMQFVTALPGSGYQLVLLADGDIASDAVPVIGFLVFAWKTPGMRGKKTEMLMVLPATAEEVFDDESPEHLLIRPDGQVEKFGDRSWASLEECKRELAAQKAKGK